MLHPLIPESDQTVKLYSDRIKQTVAKASPIVSSMLAIDWDIDIFIKSISYDISHIGGIDGTTGSPYLVEIPINFKQINDSNFEEELSSTIAHEISHCVQFKLIYGDYNNLYRSSILDQIVTEGLAVAFEKEFLGHDSITSKLYNDIDEARKIYDIVGPYFNVSSSDREACKFRDRWIVLGDKDYDLPFNAGYILGYCMVNNYLDLHGMTASETLKNAVPAQEFRIKL